MQREVVKANIVVFIASFCTLVIELVAGRIMAPYVGVSLYTWTSIIGVVLAGISIGAYLGGRIADRYPRSSTLNTRLAPLPLWIGGIFHFTTDQFDWGDTISHEFDDTNSNGHHHHLFCPFLFARNDLACGGQIDP